MPNVPFEFYLVTIWPIDVGPTACAKLGVGVAEELRLPDKSAEIRHWAREHARPESEAGRIARNVVGQRRTGRCGVRDPYRVGVTDDDMAARGA